MQEIIENTEVNNIDYLNEWKKVKLGDVIEHVIDNRGKTPPLSDKGIVLLQSFSLVGDSRRPKLNDKVKYVDLNTYNSAFRAGHPIKGDIIIATNGNLGEFCIIENEKLCIAQDVIGLRFNKEKIDETYMYYKLSTLESRNAIQNLNTGSTRPSVRVPHLLDYTFTIHKKVKIQQKIAQILSSLDDKIELNNAVNKNLEVIAQTLFKQWFVDFEFPNENGEPYKSSGSEMMESELGMIPKGWTEKVLYDMAEYINGTSFKSNEIYEDGIAIIKIAELKNGITSQTKYFKGDKDSKYLLKKRDILFSWSGSPETSIDIFIWDKDIESILNQHTFKVVPYKIEEYEFVHSMLKFFKKEFIEIAKNKQTTGLGHVTISDLKRLKIAIPDDENTINQFKEKVENIYEKMMNIQEETQTLTKLRDELLPKLMSGEVRV